jgi:hypothetical protein
MGISSQDERLKLRSLNSTNQIVKEEIREGMLKYTIIF